MRRKIVVLSSAFLLAGSVARLSAQANSAQASGTVYDGQDLPVAGAHVLIANEETAQRFEGITNDRGGFLMPSMPVGQYLLTVESPGFKPYTRTGISLVANQEARLDVRLELGALSEKITVQAELSPVNTTTATLGTLVDNRRLENMPLNGRNVLTLAQLAPGISREALDDSAPSSNQQRINVNGARSYSTNIIMDGASMVHAHRGQGLLQPPPDAVQELQVFTNGVSAEFGRGSAVITTVTRGGTNQFHGSAWDFLRNDALDARSFFAKSVPKLRRNQFGGTFGGPIRHDKLFFFGSYQHLKESGEGVVSSAFPPTAEERAGDFSHSRDAKPNDPSTKTPFPGGIIPSSRIDPVALKLAARIPLPNQPNGGYIAQRPIPNDDDMIMGRADYNLSQKDRTSGRVFWKHPKSSTPFGGSVDGYSPSVSFDTTRNIAVNHAHTFSSSVLVSIHSAFTSFKASTENVSHESLAALGSKFITGGGPGGLPNLAMGSRMSANAVKDGFFASGVQEGGVDLSWFRGKHELKFGNQVQRLNYYLHLSGRSYGEFIWDGAFTGNPMADFFLGPAASLRQEAFRINDVSYFNVGTYVQDRWRVTKRLTLNLGLRWELFTPWRAYDGQFSSLVPGVQSKTFPTAPLGLLYQDESAFPVQRSGRNLGPRIGFAYDVFGDGKTSLRGGYTISYDPLIGQVAAQNSPPFAADVITTNVGPLTDPQRNITVPYGKPIDLKTPVFVSPVVLTTSFLGDLKTANSQNVNLTFEREVVRNTMVQASYVANLGRHVTTTNQMNYARYIPGQSTTQNTDARRIYPNFSSVQAYAADAVSSYHGLQLVVSKRYARGFTISGAYAYAKSLDENGTSEVSDNWWPQDPNNRHGSKGLSDYDNRQRLVVSWAWELPFLRTNKSFAGRALGGWEFAGFSTVRTGQPFTVVSGRDNSLRGTNAGYNQDRPNLFGEPSLPADRPKADRLLRYFDYTKFQQNAPGTYGSAGRNILTGPEQMNVDMMLNKRFPLWSERRHIEFRWDVFNVLNRANFSNPNSNLNTLSTIGKITSAGLGRIMQLSLRVAF